MVLQLFTAVSALISAIMWMRSARVPECMTLDLGVVGEERKSELQEEFRKRSTIKKLFGGYDNCKIKDITDSMFLTGFYNRSAASFASVSAFLLCFDSLLSFLCR